MRAAFTRIPRRADAPAQSPAEAHTDSDADSAPPKKKAKKQQPSRSIKSIEGDLQAICTASFEFLKIYLTNHVPWPRISPNGGPSGDASDQFETLLLKAWHSACVQLQVGRVTPTEDSLRIVSGAVYIFIQG